MSLFLQATLSILLQASKGEDPLFGDLPFENHFLLILEIYREGRADNILEVALTFPAFMLMAHSKRQCRKSARLPLSYFSETSLRTYFFRDNLSIYIGNSMRGPFYILVVLCNVFCISPVYNQVLKLQYLDLIKHCINKYKGHHQLYTIQTTIKEKKG